MHVGCVLHNQAEKNIEFEVIFSAGLRQPKALGKHGGGPFKGSVGNENTDKFSKYIYDIFI